MKTSNTTNSTLTITPKPPAEAEPLVLDFSGNIDAHAAAPLQSLYALPSGAVRLDFSAVQRVNSMGLALLLKLFEHCDRQGVNIRVAHANRMTAMLFKMTNLERYLADAPKSASVPARAPAPKPTGGSGPLPSGPTQNEPAQTQPQPAIPSAPAKGGKLKFLANMQSSQQLNGWYFFNTYLQRRLDLDIHLDLVHAAWDNELQPASIDLVFARPFQATRLLLQHEFHLIARPSDQADEVTVLVRADDERRVLAEFEGARVVTDTTESFDYLLGRFLLDEGGLPSDSLRYSFTGHEIKAVRTLLSGEADILFMQTENYKSMSALTRSRLRALEASDSGLAFHLICLAPTRPELLPGLRSTLLEMPRDGKGRQVLQDLGLEGWSEPAREEIDMLAMLYQRYVGPSLCNDARSSCEVLG